MHGDSAKFLCKGVLMSCYSFASSTGNVGEPVLAKSQGRLEHGGGRARKDRKSMVCGYEV